MQRIQRLSAITVLVMSGFFGIVSTTTAAFLVPRDVFENAVMSDVTDELQNQPSQEEAASTTIAKKKDATGDKKDEDKREQKNKNTSDDTDIWTENGALVPPHPTTTDTQSGTSTMATSTATTTAPTATTTPVGGTTLPSDPPAQGTPTKNIPPSKSDPAPIVPSLEENKTGFSLFGFNRELSPLPIYGGPIGFSKDTTRSLLAISLVSGIFGILFLFGIPATLLQGFRAMSGFRGKLLGPDITYEK